MMSRILSDFKWLGCDDCCASSESARQNLVSTKRDASDLRLLYFYCLACYFADAPSGFSISRSLFYLPEYPCIRRCKPPLAREDIAVHAGSSFCGSSLGGRLPARVFRRESSAVVSSRFLWYDDRVGSFSKSRPLVLLG